MPGTEELSMKKTARNSPVRERKIVEMRDVRRKFIGDYFLNMSRFHRPWLIELAERYKSRGEFPAIPMFILPSYYSDKRDIEVAAFASLLIDEGGDSFGNISEFRSMLGESPWQWFKERRFVQLSIGQSRSAKTGGVANRKIARLFDRIWGECRTDSGVQEIGSAVDAVCADMRCCRLDALYFLTEDCGIDDVAYRIRLLLLFLSASDGFSLGLWGIGREELKCPLTRDLRAFLKTWFPDYMRYGGADEAIRLFGFGRDCDFFYAYLGYKELQARHPKECSEKTTRYISWYTNGTYVKPCYWRGILPQIDF